MTFRVNGLPKGQPRPRAFARKIGDKFMARMYDAGTAEAWKQQVTAAAEAHVPGIPYDLPLCVTLDFEMPRPKSLMRRKDPDGPVWCGGRPDCDNLAKAVLDALTMQGWWLDDALVVELLVSKRFHAKDGRPGCSVDIMLAEHCGDI